MRKAKSVLIEQFLHDVDDSLIVGQPGSSGHDALVRMRDALRDILDGAPADAALGLKRTKGARAKPHTLWVALVTHNLLATGEKWSVIERRVNEFLRRRGEPELKLNSMMTMYKSNLPEVERILGASAKTLVARIDEDSQTLG